MKNSIETEHIVRIRTDEKTNKPLSETWWTTNNLRHRKNTAAQLTWDPDSGVLVREAYYEFNQLHREDGPSLILRHPRTGKIVGEAWALFGSYHRDGDKPAIWMADRDTGHIVTEEYWEDGDKHRENGPAEIHRDEKTGTVLNEVYYRDGSLLRPTEPEVDNILEP